MHYDNKRSQELIGLALPSDVTSNKSVNFIEIHETSTTTAVAKTLETTSSCIEIRQGKPWQQSMGKSSILALVKLKVRRDLLADAKSRISLWTALKDHLSPKGRRSCGGDEESSFRLVDVDPNITE